MSTNRVCSSCFSDKDLRSWIRENNGPRGCNACRKYDSPTVGFDVLVDYIEERLRRYYGRAVDQLPYCSAEGGYLGPHWDSWDMLDKIGLDFPRDYTGSLRSDIASSMTDEPWTDKDVATLDLDDALWSSWESFCSTVKHKRRFFFHATGTDARDSYTPASLLNKIARSIDFHELITELPVDIRLWRARTGIPKRKRVTATDFGPCPAQFALQSNRLNPSGIPMFYLASSTTTALKETREEIGKVGLWRSTRPIRVLDLRSLPDIPGIFSDEPPELAQTLSFLHDFTSDIMKPVQRTEKVQIDYLPSQVVTEYFRDYEFEDGALDGVAYRSTVHRRGWNVALFLGPEDLGLANREWGVTPTPAFEFEKSVWATSA